MSGRGNINDLYAKVVETFETADARFEGLVESGLADPHKALVSLARFRETWEMLIPGIGERLNAPKTERAALALKTKKEAA